VAERRQVADRASAADLGSATARAPDAAQRARMRAALTRLPARPTALDRIVHASVRFGFRMVGWSVQAEGLERLPRDQRGRVVPCVVAVAPHRGWIDPFVLLLALPRDAPRLAWFGDGPTMARSWWRRRLFPRLGMIPIHPGAGPGAIREHVADARTVLGRGACLVILPEKGPPSPRGRTRTIAPGASWLAAAAGVPLVPVAIGGFLETGLGTRYRLRVLEPLVPDPISPETADGRRAARLMTKMLAGALAPAVEELETWSARTNGDRRLPVLRRLFH
jgi:1-acyl-sn-glycerol-3-phosphate acyltransferase